MADFADYIAYEDALGLGGGQVDTSNLGRIISSILPTLLTLAGIILFGMLVSGGFTMLAGAADKEAQEKGKKTITNALFGFAIIFLAYWIAQILQVIFKIDIVG
ncbi:MAG: hypothetical protein Fur0011_1920 [Candidatus Microgenomates bacterium]